MSSVLRLFLSQNTALLCRSLTQTGPRTASAVARVAAAAAVQQPIRSLSATGALRCAEKLDTTAAAAAAPAAPDAPNPLDRTRIVTLEQSLRYLASDAYRQTYGDQAVWEQYRRNHKGPFAPRRTRKTCVRKGAISTGNPCPICRDEYLLLDHRNLELLQQFISPHTGEILSYSKTGLCQRTHQQLLIAIERARDQGLITFDVPFRQYDYAEYYSAEQLQQAATAAPASTN